MTPAKLKQTLLQFGIQPTVAHDISVVVAKDTARHARISHKNDWEYVLHPLERQIRSLASSQCKWSKDATRAPIYAAYLLLLRKALKKIQEARVLNKDRLTIPEYAAQQQPPLPMDGLIWHAWIPDHIKDKFRIAFDTMYNDPALRTKTKGKRIVPFSTYLERTASDMRWERLITQIMRELDIRSTMPDQDPLIEALNAALYACHNREITDIAPVYWEQLLSPRRRGALTEWRAQSVDGLLDEKGRPLQLVDPITLKPIDEE